jgi:hypothetical protein
MQIPNNLAREILFKVTPAGNAYGRPAVLFKDTWETHIQPFKIGVTVEAIQTAVSTPTFIYQDKTQETRHALINNNVTTASGTKMTVFLETQTTTRYNHIATAFYNRNPNVGPLLFDFSGTQVSVPTTVPTTPSLRSSYDGENDILYLGVDDAKSAEDEEIEEGVYVGYAEGADRPRAAMVFGIRKRNKTQRDHVIEVLANALRVRQSLVQEEFDKAY